ncbi:MAG: signal peptidase I [Chloroflexi bacterium]|nr:signal peptidase I [Chloroflexota bacterium]
MESYRTDQIPDSSLPKEGHSGFLRFLFDVVETLVLSVLLFAGINAVSARIRVDGFSMEPTLKSGEFVIVNKLAYKLGEPQIGDVIVFHYPRDPQQEYIKRVIGRPGDQVQILGGKVYVNGEELDEPYVAAPAAYPDQETVVPEGALFVLGDNRNNSSDSHNWGTVPLEYVIGKAVLIYWPPESWGLINHLTPASAARE